MTKGQRLVCAVIATTIFTYLAVAFINIEMNAFRWSENGRLAFCYFSVILSWLTGGLPYFLFKEK